VRRLALVLALLCSCIGPNLISTRDDDRDRGGIVSFHGREGIGYVTAQVMEDRSGEALDVARGFCDGGVEVTDRHSEGGENFIDFKCAVAAAAPAPERPASTEKEKPCREPPPAAEIAPTPVSPPEISEPPPEPPPPMEKKKKKKRAPSSW
jgi:hypothetical protein